MDLLYLAYYLALFAIPIVAYLVLFKKDAHSVYSIPTWYYLIKKFYAKSSIKEFLNENRQNYDNIMDKYKELPKQLLTDEDSDTIQFLSMDQKSNCIYFCMSVRRDKTARISLEIQLQNGTVLRLPSKENFIIASRAKNNWSASGFNIEIVDPFKRCRFYFNGFLSKTTSNGEETFEHIRLNFIWNSAAKPLFYPDNFSENLFLEAICREPWKDGNWTSLLGDSVGYEQYGGFIGKISLENASQNIELNIPTLKKRSIGLDRALAWNRDVTFFLVGENGELLHFGVTSLKYGCTHLKFGSVFHSNGEVESISGTDMFLGHLGETGSIPKAFTIHVKTPTKTFKCVFHRKHSPTATRSLERSGFIQSIAKFEVCINTNIGTSIGLFWYQTKGEGLPPPKPLLRSLKNVDKLLTYVIGLSDSNCQILTLTGGKGSSLGVLKSLEDGQYKVPDGFVVTTEAYKHQLEMEKGLAERIDDLERIGNGCSDEELKIACENLAALFANTYIVANISVVVKKELSKLNSEAVEFAVRSSGIIEDGDDLSCAGQNQTILGCKSEQDVLEAIARCWGSLYDFNSVKYRKQNGFEIRSEMAVVVQQLVPSTVSGVLFTCHPTDSNTSLMMITANYGLGESVVSGSADPDIIVLKRTFDGQLTIHQKQLGDKATKIVSDDKQAKSVEKAVEAELSKRFCLTEEQSLELGRIGMFLEEKSGSPRDIEWAIVDGQLYLLQSRAVTTIHQWTDFELLHEFDKPVMTSLDVFTIANVGEVMPFACSTLAISTVHRQLELAIQRSVNLTTPMYKEYAWQGTAIFNQHIFLDMINVFLGQSTESLDAISKINDLAVFGHVVTKEEYIKTARDRHGPVSGSYKMQLLWENIRFVWDNQKHLKRIHKHSELSTKAMVELKQVQNTNEVYLKLEEMVLTCKDVYSLHSICSRVSIIYQIAALITLLQGNEDFTNDNYHDISLILTTNADNIISAEVPKKMQEIAGIILAAELGDEFCLIDKQSGVDWLKEKCAKAGQSLKYFLQEHGHRSFKELDIYSKSWSEDPSVLIEMIQQNVKHNVAIRERPIFTVEETFLQLKTPLKSWIATKSLKWLMGKCRNSVATREESKGELVRSIFTLRQGFYHLADLLVGEGRLPQRDLVFFLTIEEIGALVEAPSPLILSKALKRRRLHPTWNALRFPEMSEGVPTPLPTETSPVERNGNSVTSLTGTPVCNGQINARACVIKRLEEIGELKAGDVLITCSTDIAWSPYFPILGGVVTELGGLISHGAVVAREYGLPCLVGVKGATATFKTGDRVCLDSSKGTISLLT